MNEPYQRVDNGSIHIPGWAWGLGIGLATTAGHQGLGTLARKLEGKIQNKGAEYVRGYIADGWGGNYQTGKQKFHHYVEGPVTHALIGQAIATLANHKNNE